MPPKHINNFVEYQVRIGCPISAAPIPFSKLGCMIWSAADARSLFLNVLGMGDMMRWHFSHHTSLTLPSPQGHRLKLVQQFCHVIDPKTNTVVGEPHRLP